VNIYSPIPPLASWIGQRSLSHLVPDSFAKLPFSFSESQIANHLRRPHVPSEGERERLSLGLER